jgi:hypothetical protein
MKNHYFKLVLITLTLILSSAVNCYSTNISPEISIVTDNQPRISVQHSLSKLTETLRTKNISFEEIKSIRLAKGEMIIVAGMSTGKGEAAQMLKAGKHVVPEVPEYPSFATSGKQF